MNNHAEQVDLADVAKLGEGQRCLSVVLSGKEKKMCAKALQRKFIWKEPFYIVQDTGKKCPGPEGYNKQRTSGEQATAK